jgi:hypothetical protein
MQCIRGVRTSTINHLNPHPPVMDSWTIGDPAVAMINSCVHHACGLVLHCSGALQQRAHMQRRPRPSVACPCSCLIGATVPIEGFCVAPPAVSCPVADQDGQGQRGACKLQQAIHASDSEYSLLSTAINQVFCAMTVIVSRHCYHVMSRAREHSLVFKRECQQFCRAT